MLQKRIWIGFLLAACVVARTQAQSLYGSIVGNVTDATDAPVPGTHVVAHNRATGQMRDVVTDDGGRYNIPDLATGEYDVTFSKQGFATSTRTGVPVTISSISRVDLAMQIGSVTESVSVSGQLAGVLQSDSAEIRAELTSKSLENAPIPPGRNYQEMFRFLPGVTPPSTAHSIPSNPARALTFNVNGASYASNTTRIDGATSTNVQLPWVSSYVPSLESIETVDVVTNSFDAEQGLAGGSAINVHTKSGTNRLHGSAFENFTDNRLKAKPFFLPVGQGKPKLVSNEFGGTIGGPIRKDKLFYFLSYQGSFDRQNLSRFVTVPTAAIKAGDMSGSASPMYDPAFGNLQGAGRTPFPSNLIPASRISPIARQVADLTPLPNLPGLQNNYYATGPFLFDRRIGDAKIDWNTSSKLSTFLRFGTLDWNDYDQQVFGDAAGGPPKLSGGNPGTGWGRTYSLTAAATYLFSPTLIADAYFGWTGPDSSSEQARINEKIGLDQLHVPGTNGPTPLEGGWPTFAVTNYTTVGTNENYMPYYRHDPQYQYAANVNWTKGSHNIRFGADLYRQDMNQRQEQFVAGTSYGGQGGFTFAGGPTTLLNGPTANQFNTYASFLLGLPTTLGRNQLSDEAGYTVRANLFSTYIRDQWAVNPKLTISYGTRWEYIPFMKRADRGLERYDPSTNTTLICGVASTPRDCGVHISKRMFAPRFGIAYRVSDSFVVRAGYGITNDPYIETQALRANYPVLIPLVINGVNSYQSAGSLAAGIPAIVAPDVSKGSVTVPGNVAVATVNPNFTRGYLQSWNLTLQKQLKFGFSGQAAYVGTRQVHEFGFLDLNAGQVIGAGQAGQPLFQQFGRAASTTQVMSPLGTGQYNALQSTLQRRFQNGLQIGLAYTWSKTIGIADNSNSNPMVQSIRYFGLNRALTSFDRTHEFHITSVWELPFGKSKAWARSGIASALLGGWQTSNLLSMMSGTPFSVTGAATALNMTGSTQRADQIKPEVQILGGIGTSSAYFDPLAYAAVTGPRFGTAGFNSLRGPGVFNWDLSVSRQFGITERMRLQFRADAINFTNTPHFANPNTNVSNLILNGDGSIRSLGGYSTITNTISLGREGIDERQVRFGLRLSF